MDMRKPDPDKDKKAAAKKAKIAGFVRRLKERVAEMSGDPNSPTDIGFYIGGQTKEGAVDRRKVGNWLGLQSMPSGHQLVVYARNLGVELLWLEGEEGPKYITMPESHLSPMETMIIQRYRKASKALQRAVVALLQPPAPDSRVEDSYGVAPHVQSQRRPKRKTS